jgi:hypothetical protein
MDSKISEFVKKLNGITYPEWQKLSYVMNKVFSCKKRELDDKIKLSSDDELVTRVLSE